MPEYTKLASCAWKPAFIKQKPSAYMNGWGFNVSRRLELRWRTRSACFMRSASFRRLFTEEEVMPLIQVKVIEGVFTETQKREMVRKLTDAMVSIEGENMRPVTWVIVEEVDSGNWGIGGKPLTTAHVKALAPGKATWGAVAPPTTTCPRHT